MTVETGADRPLAVAYRALQLGDLLVALRQDGAGVVQVEHGVGQCLEVAGDRRDYVLAQLEHARIVVL